MNFDCASTSRQLATLGLLSSMTWRIFVVGQLCRLSFVSGLGVTSNHDVYVVGQGAIHIYRGSTLSKTAGIDVGRYGIP